MDKAAGMYKAELINAMTEKTHVSAKDNETVLRAFVEVVSEQLQNGDKVPFAEMEKK